MWVKMDAFTSYKYAHRLVWGRAMCFNVNNDIETRTFSLPTPISNHIIVLTHSFYTIPILTAHCYLSVVSKHVPLRSCPCGNSIVGSNYTRHITRTLFNFHLLFSPEAYGPDENEVVNISCMNIREMWEFAWMYEIFTTFIFTPDMIWYFQLRPIIHHSISWANSMGKCLVGGRFRNVWPIYSGISSFCWIWTLIWRRISIFRWYF